ncbi:MAG: ATP-binding protein [Defluviitaleaceae bacterium]|nr:ATP-binding protein [Defluviitaleaceae bacterium]
MGSLNVQATEENIGPVLDFVTAELKRNNLPANLQSDILVAAEEIFVNIVHYAYKPGQSGEVAINASITDKAIFRFEDTGIPFNPLEIEAPDLNVALEERKIGGLGVHLVKNLMDKVEYERAGGKNILTFTKELLAGIGHCFLGDNST